MNEAEKQELISEAGTITRLLVEIMEQGNKDILQAMFGVSKLAFRAKQWQLRNDELHSRDLELFKQGKKVGWERAAREKLLEEAEKRFRKLAPPEGVDAERQTDPLNIWGWLWMYDHDKLQNIGEKGE